MNRIIYALDRSGRAVLPMLETRVAKPVVDGLTVVDRDTWFTAFANGRRVVQDDELVQAVLDTGPAAFFERRDELGRALGNLSLLGVDVAF